MANCSGLGGSTDPRFQNKMEQNFTQLRNLAGSDQASTVLSSVLNQNMLSILHKGLETPGGDLVILTQKKNDGDNNYNYKDSQGGSQTVGPLKQYAMANINVTTEPNGDFRVTVDWPMYFNATRSLNTQTNDGSEMRLTPGNDDQVQLSRTQGSFVISKQDADRGILNLHVDTPFTVSFDGNIH